MKRSLLLLFVLSASLTAQDEVKPFPENRVRDFYANQARGFLKSEQALPQILPQFPGLDGGSWGHWGQNPEADNVDGRLNEVDTGGLLMQVIKHFGKTTHKAVAVQVGKFTVLFDPEKLTFVDAWEGGLAKWSSGRYGITSGVNAGGKQIQSDQLWNWMIPAEVPTHYEGFFRTKSDHWTGAKVSFVYKIGMTRVIDSMEIAEDALKRSVLLRDDLPKGAKAGGTVRLWKQSKYPFPFGPRHNPQWQDQLVHTKGLLGKGSGPYVIDTLTIPYRDANPFKTPMRIGGVGILGEGKVAVCTLMGDVWVVSGVDGSLDQLTWRRVAAGLHQPLGMVVRDGDIVVLGRDQLTALESISDWDSEAGFYQCLTNDFPTAGGNNFALTLHQDKQGAYHWFTRSNKFAMTKFVPGKKPESIATGLRGTNGTGVSPDGTIVLCTVQEGTWQNATAIFEVGGGSYHGFHGPRPEIGNHGYQMPLCFIPRGIDNSPGDLCFLPDDKRFGPLAGHIIGTSFGYCSHYLVLRETIGGKVQGGVVPLPGEFLSGAHRLRFNKHDGHLYVAGTDGWQSYAKENGSLQRVRYTGGKMPLPIAVETRENGLLVRFNTRIDAKSADLKNVFCEQWNYLYSNAYGSGEYSVKHPGNLGHDAVAVKSMHLLEDGRSVFVEIPQLHPVMQLHLYMELQTADGDSFQPDLYYSIFQFGKPFTDFAGYQKIAKEPWNDFPIAKDFPVDPRLLKQEVLGKTLSDTEKATVHAVAGLQFEPKRIRVKAGKRVALTVINKDPSLPHNLVLVRPDRLQAVGEGSMKLASTPEGAAQHYVIEDQGVLAMSPILQSGSQYTIYFDAPKKPGDYPYLCTYPGHWQITRGVMEVVE
jgi:azurin